MIQAEIVCSRQNQQLQLSRAMSKEDIAVRFLWVQLQSVRTRAFESTACSERGVMRPRRIVE